MRPDELERRLRERLDALGPAPRAELLHVLMLPDFERVDWISLATASFLATRSSLTPIAVLLSPGLSATGYPKSPPQTRIYVREHLGPEGR